MADNQLEKNTLRLSEFEKRINDLNTITSNVKTKVDGEVEEIGNLKTNIITLKTESQAKLDESNKQIEEKIKNQFKTELSDAENRSQENEQKSQELSKEIEDLYIKISELDTEANKKIITYRNKKRDY